MPVAMLVGVPGSGKSYEAVAFHIIPAIESGRKVITNLPLHVDKIREVYGNKADLIKLVHPSASNPIPFKTLADYGDDWRHPETNLGPLYAIDECHKCYPRGGTALNVEEWYAEHRHEGADVLLMTQSYGKVSKSIIDILHVCYRVRKNLALGSKDTYVRKVQDGPRGEVLNQTIRRYDPKFFPFYKSHTKSNASVEEAFATDIIPIWRNWRFLLAAILLPIGLYTLLSHPAPYNTAAKVKPAPVVHSAPSSSGTLAPSASPVPQQLQSKTKIEDNVSASHPFYKVQMHITGYIESEKKERFLYNIILSQNGQKVAEITNNDLSQAGYLVEALGRCMMKVTYKGFFDYITCDAPRVDTKAKDNFSTTTAAVDNAQDNSGGTPRAGGS